MIIIRRDGNHDRTRSLTYPVNCAAVVVVFARTCRFSTTTIYYFVCGAQALTVRNSNVKLFLIFYLFIKLTYFCIH